VTEQVKHKAAEQVTDLIDPDRALREVARLAYSDVGELFDEHGNLRPLHELPDHLATAIASITIVKRTRRAGEAPDVIQKVRFWDKPKALAMLCMHLGLLKERSHFSDDAELRARLEARRRPGRQEVTMLSTATDRGITDE
jgi:hypothetical protein